MHGRHFLETDCRRGLPPQAGQERRSQVSARDQERRSVEQERRCVRSLPAAWPLLQYPLRAVSLAAVAPISEARVWSQARVVFPASRTITSMHRRAWRCATACWQADEGAHLHLGQGLLLQFSLTRQPLLHRFQIVHAHSLASRALLLFFVRCCCLLRVQRHTERMSRGAREGMADTGASTSERKGQQRARGNGGTPCP